MKFSTFLSSCLLAVVLSVSIPAIHSFQPGCQMDIVIILDGPGSAALPQYPSLLKSIAALFRSFPSPEIRPGFLTYDSLPQVIFNIDTSSGMTPAQIEDTVLNTTFKGAGTCAGDALHEALNIFSSATVQRPGIPKVILFITDYIVNNGAIKLDAALLEAQTAGAIIYVLGVGANVNTPVVDTLTGADPNKYFPVTDYAAAAATVAKLESDICQDIPTVAPTTTDTTTDLPSSTTDLPPATTDLPSSTTPLPPTTDTTTTTSVMTSTTSLPPTTNVPQICPAVSNTIQCYLNSLTTHVESIHFYLEEIRAANPNPSCNCGGVRS